MQKLDVIIILFCLLDACLGMSMMNSTESESEPEEKIVGGQQIPLSRAPYQVSLQYKGYHQCGGSIVSTTFILTAAHCTYQTKARELSVRLATDRVNSGGELFSVRSTYIHPSYDPSSFNNDFSLVQLRMAINLKAGVKVVIALPPPSDPIAEGTSAYVSGWGETLNDNESNGYLRAVAVPIVNQNTCRRAYSSLTSNMVCAGDMNGGIDSCQVRLAKTFIYQFSILTTEIYFRVIAVGL